MHDANRGVPFCIKLTEQKPPRNVNLFDVSSPFIEQCMYVSFGVLAGLLLIGTLWDIFIRKKRGIRQNTVLGEDKPFNVLLKATFPFRV